MKYNKGYNLEDEPVYQKITRTREHTTKRDTSKSKERKQDYSKQRQTKYNLGDNQ